MRILTLLVLMLPGAGPPTPAAPPAVPDPPVKVFAALEGSWSGVFVGYDASGTELYRIQVSQKYHTLDEHRQAVEILDTMPDGTVITGQGMNIARRAADGSLQLRCRVNKSNGERVEHEGRVVRGPDGDEQIIWFSRGPDRVETFREFVTGTGPQRQYVINGMGQYGDQLILMAGCYRLVAPKDPAPRRTDAP